MENPSLRPKTFTLQWHITERCNWHCKHCYQSEEYKKEELSLAQMKVVFNQYILLIKHLGIHRNSAFINVTGGEPFMRKDFFEFLKYLHKKGHLFNLGILSNGSFITKKNAKKLKSLGVSYYQISIEGLEEYNDSIRGKGSFKKIIRAIKILNSEGIRTHTSLTLTNDNIKDIPELCNILEKAGTHKINTRRLIPIGTGTQFKNQIIEPLALQNYYILSKKINENFKKEGKEFYIHIGCESGVFNDEVLNEKEKKNCAIIDGRIITVMSNGDVLPCRRLPVVIGNVINQNLFELWYSSNFLWELRNLNNAHPFCKKCKNFDSCFGGAKCLTYTYYNKFFVPDVQCWKFYKKIQNPDFFKYYIEPIGKDTRFLGYLHPTDANYYSINKPIIDNVPAKVLSIEHVSVIAESNPDNLLLKYINSNSDKKKLLSFELSEKDLNQNTGINILSFINKLKESHVKFKISRPLPRCLFGAGYENAVNEFKIPTNCNECSELFGVKNEEIISCKPIDKKGPYIYYIKDKNHILKFFNTLRLLKEPCNTCKNCMYFKRRLCDGLCYRTD
jgi:radical SAM protein with 4Fe4S-binding SPASM domain